MAPASSIPTGCRRNHSVKCCAGSSAGIGSASHVNTEKFLSVAGIKAVHVPLKGAPEMITETMAGRTQFGTVGISAAQSAIRDGRLLGLAVSGKTRAPNLPDVPTVAEAGVPGAEFNFWIGVLAPGQTPRPIVNRLHAEIVAALAVPEIRERALAAGAEPLTNTPQEFAAMIREEIRKWAQVIRAAEIKLQ